MKKTVLITAVMALVLNATAANAGTDLGAGRAGSEIPSTNVDHPDNYPSWYSGRDRHRNYDWNYWHKNDESSSRNRVFESNRVNEERRLADERLYHDHGKHLGHFKKSH